MYLMYSHIKSSPRTSTASRTYSQAQFVTKWIYCIVPGSSFSFEKRNSTQVWHFNSAGNNWEVLRTLSDQDIFSIFQEMGKYRRVVNSSTVKC